MMNFIKFLLLPILVFTLAACPNQAEFKPFTSEEGRFAVLIPGKMEYKSQNLSFGEHQVTMYSYATSHNDVVYAVNYFDIPERVNSELRKQRRDYTIPGGQDMMDANGWKVYETLGDELRKPDSEIAEGQFFKAKTNKQNILVKLLWFENRIYQIMTAYPLEPSYQQNHEAKKFLYSFRIPLR